MPPPCPLFAGSSIFLVQPLCPPCLRDSCSFVFQRPASGLVRTAASLIPEYPLIPRLCFVCRDKRGTEKKETNLGLQQKRQDRQFPAAWPGKDLIVSPPPPWLLPHKRHKPLDPVRLSSASAQLLLSRTREKGKGKSLKTDDSFSSSSSNAFHQTPERPEPSGFVPTPVHQQANAQL